jgi:hypothetical protein
MLHLIVIDISAKIKRFIIHTDCGFDGICQLRRIGMKNKSDLKVILKLLAEISLLEDKFATIDIMIPIIVEFDQLVVRIRWN